MREGDGWAEFVSVGCCGDTLDVPLRVESVEGGDAVDEDTEFTFTERDGEGSQRRLARAKRRRADAVASLPRPAFTPDRSPEARRWVIAIGRIRPTPMRDPHWTSSLSVTADAPIHSSTASTTNAAVVLVSRETISVGQVADADHAVRGAYLDPFDAEAGRPGDRLPGPRRRPPRPGRCVPRAPSARESRHRRPALVSRCPLRLFGGHLPFHRRRRHLAPFDWDGPPGVDPVSW